MSLFINEFIGALTQLLLFSLVPVIWWLCTAVKKENFFKWIGLKKGCCKTSVIKMIICSVFAATCYVGIMTICINILPEGITTAGSNFSGKGPAAIPAIIAYAFIRTALAEEVLFRGFLLKRISSKFGFVVGNTVQALLFGLLHGVPFGISTGSIAVTILLTLLPGVIGWYEGWMNEKRFEGSIFPGWIMHGVVNFIVALLGI